MRSKTPPARHQWRFFRVGGIDQVVIDSAADIENLATLDQKLWVALSCPVKGLEFDTRTLELLDSDQDGHVHVKEVLRAIEFCKANLRDLGSLLAGADALPLAAIDKTSDSGRRILSSAKRMLEHLRAEDTTRITVDQASDLSGIFGAGNLSGDGIVCAEAAGDDAELAQVIGEIVSTQGGEADRSGEMGASQAQADAFFAELEALRTWLDAADDGVLTLGDATADAAAAVRAVAVKVDDFFARCRLATYDARAIEALNRLETEYLEVVAQDLSVTADEISGFPLARIEPGKSLPLGDELNPAWSDAVGRMIALIGDHVLGESRDRLSAADWAKVRELVAPYLAWADSKPATKVADLGEERLRAILDADLQTRVNELIAADLSLAPDVEAFAEVERLTRYHRDLVRLLHNFVSFADFYDPTRKATFQAGTLYLDTRACDLCVRVDDPAKHGALAGLAMTYLAYCDLHRGGLQKMQIAAAITGGDSDNLRVGRNGIFYDRQGLDWDATVTKIIEHPISIRQAFWSPYKRVVKMVEDQIHKMAASKDQAATAGLGEGIGNITADAGEGRAASAFDVAKFAGVFAAIGLAIGAIGGALATMGSKFTELELWQKPVAIAGILLLVSGPSMLIASMKLRRRNLGPILDANGWAVNGRVKINIPFGGALTQLPSLPPGARRLLTDPYRRKRRVWPWLLVLLLGLGAAGWWLNEQGKIHEWTGYGKVVVEEQPGQVAPPPAEGETPPAEESTPPPAGESTSPAADETAPEGDK